MKVLFEFFPLILFFIAFKIKGIFAATAAALIATIVQVLFSKWKYQKIDTVLWINFIVILLLGGLTLISDNRLFIQYKPTVLYWLFSVVLLISDFFFKNNLLAKLLEKKGLHLTQPVWRKLNLSWSGFLILLGYANIYFVRHFSEAQWVNFKIFGTTAAIFCFVLLQAALLSKYLEK